MTPDIKLLFHLLSAMDMIARMKIPTAAILVIGDEILSGKTEDQNARLLIGELRELGVALRRIVTIPDDVEEVAVAVRELSARFDHVFTSGGVGPTHDDVTLAGVARAFDVPLVRHPNLEARLNDRIEGSAMTLTAGMRQSASDLFRVLQRQRQQDLELTRSRFEHLATRGELKEQETDEILSALLQVARLTEK